MSQKICNFILKTEALVVSCQQSSLAGHRTNASHSVALCVLVMYNVHGSCIWTCTEVPSTSTKYIQRRITPTLTAGMDFHDHFHGNMYPARAWARVRPFIAASSVSCLLGRQRTLPVSGAQVTDLVNPGPRDRR